MHRYRGGLVREDPAHIRVIVPKGMSPSWNLEGRLDEQERSERMQEEIKKIAVEAFRDCMAIVSLGFFPRGETV